MVTPQAAHISGALVAMITELESEVERWSDFVHDNIDSPFRVLEIRRDEDHSHRHNAGYWHLYSFWLNDDTCLKIGLAGPNSAARFNSQHYNPNSANSNLAKSLLKDSRCTEPAKDWIIANTYRINAVFSDFTQPLAHALETHLHLVFRPVYERSRYMKLKLTKERVMPLAGATDAPRVISVTTNA
jgi:hypothetical protein